MHNVSGNPKITGSVHIGHVYREAPLPPQCPPTDATLPDDVHLLRLVEHNPPTTDDFKSGFAEGRRKPSKCDQCTWQACSLWLTTTKREKLTDLAKLPNLASKKFIATISVDQSSGKMKPHTSNPDHIAFWIFATFAPETAVVKVEPL